MCQVSQGPDCLHNVRKLRQGKQLTPDTVRVCDTHLDTQNTFIITMHN